MVSAARSLPAGRTRIRVAARRRTAHRGLVYIGLCAYALIAVFPLYWLFKSSLTVGLDLIAATPSLFPHSLDFPTVRACCR
jgi:ABC-type glycerol-3-phosphate transport system permease component